MALYVNGVKQTYATDTSTTASGASIEKECLGQWGDLAIRSFNGRMDDLRIYSRALSASEVLQLYETFQPSPLWSGAVYAGSWKWLNWFGYFSDYGNGWVFHAEHGWMYCVGTSAMDIWFWSSSMGWMWSGQGAYPFIWRNLDSTWLWYYQGTASPRWFHNYVTGINEWRF